jgi:hypothetical protein
MNANANASIAGFAACFQPGRKDRWVLVKVEAAGVGPWDGWIRSRCGGFSPGCRANFLASRPAWVSLALAKRSDILGVLVTSVLTPAGTFTVYTYLSVFVAGVVGLGPQGLALVLLGFGLASAVGTQLGGSAADRWGARRIVNVGLGEPLQRRLQRALVEAGHSRSPT